MTEAEMLYPEHEVLFVATAFAVVSFLQQGYPELAASLAMGFAISLAWYAWVTDDWQAQLDPSRVSLDGRLVFKQAS